MSHGYIIEIKEREDPEGNLFIEIPPILLNKLCGKEGDEVKFTTTPEGSIQVRKVKMETVELNFSDDELFKYMRLAHEMGMSLNELCAEALKGCHDSNNPHLADHPFDPLDHEQTK